MATPWSAYHLNISLAWHPADKGYREMIDCALNTGKQGDKFTLFKI